MQSENIKSREWNPDCSLSVSEMSKELDSDELKLLKYLIFWDHVRDLGLCKTEVTKK